MESWINVEGKTKQDIAAKQNTYSLLQVLLFGLVLLSSLPLVVEELVGILAHFIDTFHQQSEILFKDRPGNIDKLHQIQVKILNKYA